MRERGDDMRMKGPYHATVTPVPAWVEREHLREEPELREDRVASLPREDVHDSEPELAPGRDALGTSIVTNPLASLGRVNGGVKQD